MEKSIFTKGNNQNLIQLVKFVGFSISAGIIQVITFTLLFELTHFPYWPAYLIALTLSVLWNFTLNRKFTFKSANNIPIAMLKVTLFYSIFTPLSTWWGHALTEIGWNEYFVLFITMISNLLTEFLYTKYYVYKNSIYTAIKYVR
ncbi:GtrA family protein [Peloplasma aerotolerans]|uniref:GtrA family protein n=1 Tax=Peloplasma aerotolerans TaxID=3044389 RepID=A0AAW6U4D9_9MOLU|nr:GtrA family protein [Mariniplasma sp. M4Ah]MDI6452777.1 GtrA family protein [Mariniplasma sp. M4Ah]MDR4969470.1 GtrA family protein [Acholeplasmataceae bacterium]